MRIDWSSLAIIMLAVALLTLASYRKAEIAYSPTNTVVSTGNPITDYINQHYPNHL